MLETTIAAVLYAFTLTLPAFGGVDAHIEARSLDACNKMRRLTKIQLMLSGVDYTLSGCELKSRVQTSASDSPIAGAVRRVGE